MTQKHLVGALLAAAILMGTSTMAQAQVMQGLQSASAPLVVTATVVSSCKVSVPRQVQRSAMPTTPVDVACTRSSRADARVAPPAAAQSQTSVGDGLVVINF